MSKLMLTTQYTYVSHKKCHLGILSSRS